MGFRQQIGEIGRIPKVLVDAADGIHSTGVTFIKVSKIDPRYLDPRNWSVNSLGYPTLTWMRLHNGRIPGDDLYLDVVLQNIKISISRTPTIVETLVTGYSTTVKQFISNNDYIINITGIIDGPTFWSQDTATLKRFIKVMNLGEILTIQNPELTLIYDIKKVIVNSWNLDQGDKYQIKNFSLSLKSDKDISIINNIGENYLKQIPQ